LEVVERPRRGVDGAVADVRRIDDREDREFRVGILLEREVEGAEAATTLFRQGVDMCPDDPALWLELAVSLSSMGEPHRARTAFTRGSQIRPRHLALIQAWAEFEMDRGNLHLASKLFAVFSRMHSGSSSPGVMAVETG